MNRMQRYEKALQVAQATGNVFFEMSIKREIELMQNKPELAAEEATPNDES